MRHQIFPSHPSTFRKACSGRWPRILASALTLVLLAVFAPAALAQKKAATVAEISRPAYLSEVRAQLLRAGVTNVNADAIIASLGRLDMTQIVELADGAKAGQLERMLPGTAINAPPPSNAVDAARGAGGSTGPASQQALQGAKDSRGGFVDSRGQTSSCHACPKGGFMGSGSGQTPYDGDAKTFTTQAGVTISIYGDGSVKIQGANGTVEYLDSKGTLVNASNRPVTPNPDAERPLGAVTLADIKGLEARFGSKVTPTGESRSTGGGDMITSRTGQLGQFTEDRQNGRASIAQLQEIMRVAAEKLGPKLGR